MSPFLAGPIVGVLVVVVLSLLGVVVARVLGGSVHDATMQMYGAASVVLLVTIASRLETLRETRKD